MNQYTIPYLSFPNSIDIGGYYRGICDGESGSVMKTKETVLIPED